MFFASRDWVFLGPVAVFAMVFAAWGFSLCIGGVDCQFVDYTRHCTGSDCTYNAPWVILQNSISLIVGRSTYSFENKNPWQLVLAQYLVPGIALFAAGKLVMANLRRDVRVAFARNSHDHTIVCGLGDTGRHVVENLRAIGKRVVAINEVNDSANALFCENSGVPVIKGDATDARTLSMAGISRAEAVVLTSGDDAVNLEIAFRADEVVSARRSSTRKLRVLAEMRNDWLYRTLIDHRGAVIGSKRVEFKAFNAHENAARLLFRSPAFARRRRAMSATAPHLMVVGFGRMGREVVAHAVRTAFALPSERLAVTIVDDKGEASAADFFTSFSGLGEIADIDFIAAGLIADAPANWAPVDDALKARPPTAVIVCLPDDDQSLFASLRFRTRLDELQHTSTPVFVRLRQSRKLGAFTSRIEQLGPLQDRLVPFGDLTYLTSIKVLFEDDMDTLARIHHEQWLKTVEPSVEHRGPAQRSWEQLAETFKQANRQFADHVGVKLRGARLRVRPTNRPKLITLSATEVDELAAMEHWRWSIERRMAGWRYGPDRDNIRRLHPLLVDWPLLDEKTREENREQVRSLPDMLGAVGLELQREEIISAVGAALTPAFERAEEFHSGRHNEHLIVVIDPLDPRSLQLTRKVADVADVSVWLLLTRKAMMEFAKGPDSRGEDSLNELSRVAEGWITTEELDHLEGGARPAASPRAKAVGGA